MKHELTFEIKMIEPSGGDGPGGFAGHVAVFGNVDSVGDRIVPGAFAKHLEFFKSSGYASYNHFGTALPVATIADAYEDAKGLYVEFEFHSTREAQDVRTVIRERLDRGKSVKCSILYQTIGAKDVTENGRTVRDLTELKLYEAGAVAIPVNDQAGVVAAKSAPTPDAIDGARVSPLNSLYLRFRGGR